MIKLMHCKWIIVCCMFLTSIGMLAQENKETVIGIENNNTVKLRAKNSVTPGGGFSILDGNYENPNYENFGQIGYKRFLSKAINVNVNYKKYHLDFDQQEFNTNGFMSLDLNVEFFILPENKLTPYVYVGSGLVVDNDITETNNKVQGGLGVEYLVSNNFGLALLADGNYIFNQDINAIMFQGLDEFYFGAMLGVNFYFGNSYTQSNSKRVTKNKASDQPTVINSNPILYNKARN